MPRAAANRASTHFISHGPVLSNTARAALFELLGRDSVDPLIVGKLQWALGIALEGREHLDHAPRPTHYVTAYKAIEREARKLSERLFEMGYVLSAELSARSIEPNGLAANLLTLAETSKAIVNDFSGKPSSGAAKNTALCITIWHLRKIFWKCYLGPRKASSKQGAFKIRSEMEKRELGFVRTALREARIIPANYRELERLFLDTRCIPPQPRGVLSKRIAQKVWHAREQEQKRNFP